MTIYLIANTSNLNFKKQFFPLTQYQFKTIAFAKMARTNRRSTKLHLRLQYFKQILITNKSKRERSYKRSPNSFPCHAFSLFTDSGLSRKALIDLASVLDLKKKSKYLLGGASPLQAYYYMLCFYNICVYKCLIVVTWFAFSLLVFLFTFSAIKGNASDFWIILLFENRLFKRIINIEETYKEDILESRKVTN